VPTQYRWHDRAIAGTRFSRLSVITVIRRSASKPTHAPKTTAFVEKLADVLSIYHALPEPVNLDYAIGAMAGFRTGELLQLQWSSVDLGCRASS
jgi:integrase